MVSPRGLLRKLGLDLLTKPSLPLLSSPRSPPRPLPPQSSPLMGRPPGFRPWAPPSFREPECTPSCRAAGASRSHRPKTRRRSGEGEAGGGGGKPGEKEQRKKGRSVGGKRWVRGEGGGRRGERRRAGPLGAKVGRSRRMPGLPPPPSFRPPRREQSFSNWRGATAAFSGLCFFSQDGERISSLAAEPAK